MQNSPAMSKGFDIDIGVFEDIGDLVRFVVFDDLEKLLRSDIFLKIGQKKRSDLILLIRIYSPKTGKL